MEFRRQLVECMASLVSQGLMTGTGGNASVRLKGGNEVLITPSGVYKASLKPEDIVKIDL
ncbi:MAG: class II aldolase/adducin family protein [Caldisericales bacterium]|nr:class II aldolase/adducin family protein [Caldisericales bacterium]